MKMSFLSQFVIGISLTCIAVGYGCDNGWVAHGISCYKFTNHKLGWPQAQEACLNMGGRLANLETEEEIIWMRGYRSYHSELRKPAWVGGFEKDEKWLWKGNETDSPILITDWAAGEPKTLAGQQGCLQLLGDHHDAKLRAKSHWFKFDDTDCTHNHRFICEVMNK